ncbi:MAG TPA: hypothetical protein VF601_17125 [Beijerinckiaceae bacterium]|jgi:hypothetical protein
MRFAFALLAFSLLASPAFAQAGNGSPNFQGGAAFNSMTAADAARLNQAVKNDPQARQAVDQVQKTLNDAGHRSGQLLEKTR